jgi:hypothetical protein
MERVVSTAKCSFRRTLVMPRYPPAGPTYRAARWGRRASEFAARFVRTIWERRTDSTTSEKTPLTTMS